MLFQPCFYFSDNNCTINKSSIMKFNLFLYFSGNFPLLCCVFHDVASLYISCQNYFKIYGLTIILKSRCLVVYHVANCSFYNSLTIHVYTFIWI
jgi:hypothetical protein